MPGSAHQLSLHDFNQTAFGKPGAVQLPFVEKFGELGICIHEPVHSYSARMEARLASAASMAVNFDCFLIDEIVAVGDARFQTKCHDKLFLKRADQTMIIVSRDPGHIRAHSERAEVLYDGQLLHFPTVDDAFHFYTGHPA